MYLYVMPCMIYESKRLFFDVIKGVVYKLDTYECRILLGYNHVVVVVMIHMYSVFESTEMCQ